MNDDVCKCPYCGGDENKCNFSFETEHCSQIEPVFVSFGTAAALAPAERGTPLPTRLKAAINKTVQL